MPEAEKNYFITELEMCGLAINIAIFSHLLERVDFVIDHLVIKHIMKTKMEPATNRIKRLLEVLSSYSFNLYYIKGKDMVLSDYLSRQTGDKSDLHQVIPISFNIKKVSPKPCQDKTQGMFMVQTRSQAKGVKSPVKGKSTDSTCKKVQDIKPIIIEDDDDQDISNQKRDKSSSSRDIKSHIKPPNLPNQVYPQPNIRPPPRPPDPPGSNSKVTVEIEANLDFEENSPHQEGIITETYESPDKFYLEQPQELSDLVDSTKIIHKYLPEQVDIDMILNIIKRKVLKGTHLPLAIKEIQSDYLSNSFFKDLFVYLAQNKLPHKKNAIHKVSTLSQNYVLLDQLLFKLIMIPDKEKALLAIPESCTDKIISLYHNSLFAGHQEVIKNLSLSQT